MIITKKHLSRRMMLRGLGASFALPLLDSMIPAMTALAQTAAAPVRRLGVFYVPNGMSMPYWFPKTEGPLKELPPTLASLNEFKDQVLLCGGLADEPVQRAELGVGEHLEGYLAALPDGAVDVREPAVAERADQLERAEDLTGGRDPLTGGGCGARVPRPMRPVRRNGA